MADSYRFHPQKVRCVETGEVFRSIYAAGKSVEGNQKQNQINIRACCRKDREVCKGFHWEFVEGDE